jgi:membrane-anchored protein YejM (alkaline phosphatase superfamily)
MVKTSQRLSTFHYERSTNFMRNIYIYLSWTGWIWFLICAIYLAIRLTRGKRTKLRAGFPVILTADKTADSTEAKKSE